VYSPCAIARYGAKLPFNTGSLNTFLSGISPINSSTSTLSFVAVCKKPGATFASGALRTACWRLLLASE